MINDLEKKLKGLKEDEEITRSMCNIAINTSDYLFKTAKKENSRLKQFFCLFMARRIQNQAIYYFKEANNLSDKYFKVRDELKYQIERNAAILGCKVRFEYPQSRN